MKRKPRFILLAVTGLLILSLLFGCAAGNTATLTLASTAAAETAGALSTEVLQTADYDDEDLDASWSPGTATAVTLMGSTAAVTGSGASVTGSTLTITQAGTYVVSGTLSDGQIVVAAGKEDTVRIVLNGASIANADGPALYGQQAEKLIVILADGTVNQLTDGAVYAQTADENAPDAALFSQDDLSLVGNGALTVNGTYKHGIVTKDDLVITGGSISVSSPADGIQGKDSIAVKAGFLTVQAGSDGLQASNDSEEDKGWIVVDGGRITVSAGDDGLHAETDLVVNGGVLQVEGSYEGIEGKAITLAGGTVSVTAQDDGINATDPAAASQEGGQPPAGHGTADPEVFLRITGGTVTVNASGDGLDANGNFFMTGGTVVVNGPTGNGNGALDYDGSGTVSGGTLVALGSSGMVQSPDAESTQASLTVFFTTVQDAGTPVTVTDAQGAVVMSVTPAKQYQSVVFSSADLKQGGTYTLSTGGTLSSVPADGLAFGGTLTGGKVLTTVTLGDMATRISEDGSAAPQGGPGGTHGDRPRPPAETP